ncbi:MAG: hypothetical protein JSS38_03615 [Nitrospira sp.]|nr:hypothetical protein [Nitrospira sp.]
MASWLKALSDGLFDQAVRRSALSMFTLAPVVPSNQTQVDLLRVQEERRRS